jgi:hypothetical protein
MFQEISQKFSRKLMFTSKVLTGGHTKSKIMNPSFEKVDLLVASLGALSKLTTTGEYTSVFVEFGTGVTTANEVTFSKSDATRNRFRKLRLTAVGDPLRLPRDTPLSTEVGTKFC